MGAKLNSKNSFEVIASDLVFEPAVANQLFAANALPKPVGETPEPLESTAVVNLLSFVVALYVVSVPTAGGVPNCQATSVSFTRVTTKDCVTSEAAL